MGRSKVLIGAFERPLRNWLPVGRSKAPIKLLSGWHGKFILIGKLIVTGKLILIGKPILIGKLILIGRFISIGRLILIGKLILIGAGPLKAY